MRLGKVVANMKRHSAAVIVSLTEREPALLARKRVASEDLAPQAIGNVLDLLRLFPFFRRNPNSSEAKPE